MKHETETCLQCGHKSTFLRNVCCRCGYHRAEQRQSTEEEQEAVARELDAGIVSLRRVLGKEGKHGPD